MNRSRTTLLVVSCAVVLLLLGGGLAVRVGAADTVYRHVARFSEALHLVEDNYVDPVDPDRLLEGAFDGMMTGLDASGTYLTPPEVQDWLAKEADREGDADPGLAVLKSFGALQVVRVVPGSPAETAGIAVGDQIRSVDGKPMRDVSLEQGLRMLRGKPGSSVKLGILQSSEGLKREELSLVRSRRSAPAFRLDVRGETAVLAVADLARAAGDELGSALRGARSQGASRLLIDLRDVVEGTPREAVALVSQFVPGVLAVRKDRTGRVLETLTSQRKEPLWSAPVGVLVNGATAGGSEAVALVLRSSIEAPVFGQPTYGRGAEPKLFRLSNGAGILLPASRWETASGRTWEADGLKPDLAVLADGKDRAAASADQLRRALEEFERRLEAKASETKKAA